MHASIPRTLLVVPTYDEAATLGGLLDRVRRAVPEAHVLVVDDDSPDGTGDLADQYAADDPRVQVLHRAAKAGLGAAYAHGFRVGLDQGYEVIGEMDADGSHQPEQLPRLFDALESADVVIGSRWIPGGRVHDWPWHRLALSRAGNAYTRLVLDLGISDSTAGFRLYRADALARIDLDRVQSLGYAFQTEMALRAVEAGLRVVEVPIDFVERSQGTSKMTPRIAGESLLRITRWGLARRRRTARVDLRPGAAR